MITKKVAMLGSWGVGKTSLVRQFINSVFEEKYLSTLGVKVDTKVVSMDGHELKLMLWDIAGAEEKFSVPMHYVKGSAAYLLVVDGTRAESLQTAQDLVAQISTEIGDLPFVVAVNKNDLKWQIDLVSVEKAFEGKALAVLSTSAKTGENVEAAFAALANSLIS